MSMFNIDSGTTLSFGGMEARNCGPFFVKLRGFEGFLGGGMMKLGYANCLFDL